MTTTTQSATKFFDGETEEFAANYSKKASFKDRLNIFVEAVKETTKAPGRILDFGCGPGIISVELGKLGYNVTGLDGSAEMVRMCRGRAEKLGLKNLKFDHHAAEGVQLPVGEFDTVVCSSVVEYVVEDMPLIAKLIASLKPGGHLILSVPNASSLTGKAESAVKSLKRAAQGGRGRHLSYSLRRYRIPKFCAELERMGLSEIQCKSFEFPALGNFGVQLSRSPLFGVMVQVRGRKRG
jgi:2-polyprenyl-3-methyl-5-hydroxy-6-metoxy-1,4-benzoquinol methylase